MNDLIFNIKNIFEKDDTDGCLHQTQCEKYYIAPYQRGYKWGNKPVNLLFDDLYSSYELSKQSKTDSEYYLQYITVKKVELENKSFLEVIDGQQRLTTLTILFSIFDNDNSIAKDKLYYAVRDTVQSFINEYIYQDNEQNIFQNDWKNFIQLRPDYNEQDIYNLFDAKKIFLTRMEELTIDKEEFKKYIETNVKIIVNLVEPHVTSEQIFASLNTNKIPLTDVELVKGLFLTKLAREGENKSFKEILEKRSSIGRQWDEMENWLNKKSVKNFYFIGDLGMEELLKLFISKEDINDNRYSIYDNIYRELKSSNSDVLQLFTNLKLYFSILKDWYEDIEIYNLLGFILFVDKTNIKKRTLYKYFKLTKNELIRELKKLRNDILSKRDFSTLEYGNDNEYIGHLLLALSIFSEKLENSKKFDFLLFKNQRWSLEHIFPQSPKDISSNLLKEDLLNIKKLIDSDKNWDMIEHDKKIIDEDIKENDFNSLKEKLTNGIEISDNEKIILSILLENKNLHKLGNMAL